MFTTQRTLVLIKPDAFRRGLVSTVLKRFEDEGIEMVRCKLWNQVPRDLIEQHYEEHKDQPYFKPNSDFMTSGKVMSIVYEGNNVIQRVRTLQGRKTIPGTIRGELMIPENIIAYENLLHASDAVATAEREINLWLNWENSKDQ